MPDRERKRIPDHKTDVLKGPFPQDPPERRVRVEMKQSREVWRSCTRDNVETGESYFVLNPAADW